MTIVLECPYMEGEVHEFPDDWVFGGADGQHPGADPRFQSVSYTYWNENLVPIWTTSSPTCDDQAIDEFTWVASLGPAWNPVYLSSRKPGDKEHMMKLTYDKATDTVTEDGGD